MISRLFPKRLMIFVLVALVVPAQACLNSYDINPGIVASERSIVDQLTVHHVTEPWEQRAKRLREKLKPDSDYQTKNDLAVALMHTQAYAEALALLLEVESTKPGLYSTASNLGTAYELNGKNDLALHWIKEGIRLNPKAHDWTEWLHVKILEAKIQMASNPSWLDQNEIFDLVHPTGNLGTPLDHQAVVHALKYQLHERMQFVKAPDAIVGKLLATLARLLVSRTAGAVQETITVHEWFPDGGPPDLSKPSTIEETKFSKETSDQELGQLLGIITLVKSYLGDRSNVGLWDVSSYIYTLEKSVKDESMRPHRKKWWKRESTPLVAIQILVALLLCFLVWRHLRRSCNKA